MTYGPVGKNGWKTQRTKDGKTVLREPYYATNPLYVMVHDDWAWEECPLQEAREYWALNWETDLGESDPRYHAGRLGPSGGL
jgi:hypothetical protein